MRIAAENISLTLDSAMVTGVVLAGGAGERMGGRDKGLVELAGRPLAAYGLAALREVAASVLISANRHPEAYAAFGCPVISDRPGGFQGPLAGLLSAMETARTPVLLAVPCDTPLLDADVLRRILAPLSDAAVEIAVAHDGHRLHPVIMAVRSRLAGSIADFLGAGERKLGLWIERHRWVAVDCGDRAETFDNVNTPEDLARVEALLRARTAR